MKKNESENAPRTNSLRMFKLFCVVVVCVVLLSLLYRTALLLQNSKFDGQNGFIMVLRETAGKKAVVYSFDPKGGTISITTVTGETSPAHLRQVLAIPLDGYLENRAVSERTFPLEVSAYSLYSPKEKTDITLVDAVRLWWLFRGTSEVKLQRASVTIPEKQQSSDDEMSSLFLDTGLETDKKTIAIVNATAVSGLGSRLERVLSHIGASVISITTAHQTVPTSRIIYYGERTYTVERLSRMLSYPVEQRGGSSVSDIIIEIGDDQQRTTFF